MNRLRDTLEVLSAKIDSCVPDTGVDYKSLYHWVFTNGSAYESKALTPSEWARVREQVVHSDVKECFSNCQRIVLDPLFLHINEVARGELGVLSPFQYVEGYVLDYRLPIPIYHAWLSLNGKVVDPTLKLDRKYRRQLFPQKVMGLFPSTREYYGSVIPWREVAQCIKRNLAWHCVLEDWRGGSPLLKSRR